MCEAAGQDERDAVYHRLFVVDRAAGWGETTAVRVGKMDRQGGTADDVQYLGELVRLRVDSVACYGPVDEAAELSASGMRPLLAEARGQS